MEGVDPDFIDFVKKLVVGRRVLRSILLAFSFFLSIFLLSSHCITKR